MSLSKSPSFLENEQLYAENDETNEGDNENLNINSDDSPTVLPVKQTETNQTIVDQGASSSVLANKNNIHQLWKTIDEQQQLIKTFMEGQSEINQTFSRALAMSTPRKENHQITNITPITENNMAGQSDLNIPSLQNVNLPDTNVQNNIRFSNAECKQLVLSLTNQSRKIKIDKPEFSGLSEMDPITFLKEFQRYCKFYQIPLEDYVEVIRTCLKLHAREWFEIGESGWIDFEQFKSDFLNYFWSESKQFTQRLQLSSMRFSDSKHANYSQYFLQQMSKYRTFTLTMSESTIISEIMQQFPVELQSLWATVHQPTLSAALTFLEKQDNVQTNVKNLTKSNKPPSNIKNVNFVGHGSRTFNRRQFPNVHYSNSRENFTRNSDPFRYSPYTQPQLPNASNPPNNTTSTSNRVQNENTVNQQNNLN